MDRAQAPATTLVALLAASHCHPVGLRSTPPASRAQEPHHAPSPGGFRFRSRPSSAPRDPVSLERSRSLAGLKAEAPGIVRLATKISNAANPRQNKNRAGHKLPNVGPFLRWSPGLPQQLRDLEKVPPSASDCPRECCTSGTCGPESPAYACLLQQSQTAPPNSRNRRWGWGAKKFRLASRPSFLEFAS